MKKLFLSILVLGLLLTSNSYSSDTDGRWRGLVSCEWSPFYKLNNGDFAGIVDLTIKNDYDDASKKIIEVNKWLYPSWIQKGGTKIKSYKIYKKKIKITSKEPKEEHHTKKWIGKLIGDNAMSLKDEHGDCKGTIYRTEEITFDAYTPRFSKGFMDGVENDKKYTITGLLALPKKKQKKYPVMIMIMNSACDYGLRNFALGDDIKREGVATLELENCKPRGLGIHNMILQGNFAKLTPWMGAADALYALKFLHKHPKINSEKIGIMGFSWGGNVAVYTALDIIRKPIIKDDNINDFALRIGAYPYCRYLEEQGVTKGKIHMFSGAEDESTPALFCKDMTDSINKFGGNASIDIYPGAYHNFDDIFKEDQAKFNDRMFKVTNKCKYWVAKDGSRSWRMDDKIIDMDAYKGWDFSSDKNYNAYKKECEPPWGAIVGRNDKAAELAAKKLIKLINKHLK
jgi:dienelactone hydrolase